MSEHVNKLRDEYATAEAERVRLDSELTEKTAALREKYLPRLEKAGTRAATAQKVLCDAEAAETLRERYDAAYEAGDEVGALAVVTLAGTLNLQLPASE